VFKIPDMLANRADIYNLGDVLSGNDGLFSLSCIEKSLTSNPVVLPLSSRVRMTFACSYAWPKARRWQPAT
jgi:hypothetical protein